MKSRTSRLSMLLVVLVLVLALAAWSCAGETGETTNKGTTTTTTATGSQSGNPDLVIESVAVEPGLQVAPGEVVKFRLTIKNIGTAHINSSFYILLGNDRGFSGGIQAGQSREITVDWSKNDPGTYDVVWTADYGKRVLEDNEENNTSETFTIVVR